jgi:ribonuclease HII
VVAAVVILDPAKPIRGLADSKTLTPLARERLADKIRERALAWAVGRASVEEIDRINILWATMLAMERAVAALTLVPDLALIDGNRAPKLSCKTRTVIGGDASVRSISAASILAKVTRDAEMCDCCREHPGYGFSKHKGYGTPEHLEALRRLGPSAIHRRSFAPVQEALR